MDLDDTLRDRLSAAATTTTARPLRAATTVRRSAERHRAQRRGAAAVVVVAAAATAVALGSTLGPQLLSAPPAVDPTPSVTDQATPSPTTPEPSSTEPPPTQTETEAPPEPQVTQQEATAFVEAFRFADEAQWSADPDIDIFPVTVDTSTSAIGAFGCGTDDGARVRVPGALAVRSVSKAGAESGSSRELAVFADETTAAATFATLRETMRACHAEPTRMDDGVRTVETTYVGEQLALGKESFWVAARDVVVEADDPASVGTELFYATAVLYVLDGTTVTAIEDPASSDETRAQFVADAGAEWEALRPQLEGLGG